MGFFEPPQDPSTHDDWEGFKATITAKYLSTNASLQDFVREMGVQYAFNASEPMYVQHLSRWGLTGLKDAAGSRVSKAPAPVPSISRFFSVSSSSTQGIHSPYLANESALRGSAQKGQLDSPFIRPPYPTYSLPAMPGSVIAQVDRPGTQTPMDGTVGAMPPIGFNNAFAADPRAPYRQTQFDRPFHCDRCPQTFDRNHDLKRHNRIHLAEKPFPCKHCEKNFSLKDALKRHILVKGCGIRGSRDATSTSDDENSRDDQLGSKEMEHVRCPREDTMFISYTISEDRCGSQNDFISSRLAALGENAAAPRSGSEIAAMEKYTPARFGGQAMQAAHAAAQSGTHALQDYQRQFLNLLAQQNKKRSMMARQEQGHAVNGSGRPMLAGMAALGERSGG